MRGHQKIAKKSLRVRLWKDYQKRAGQVPTLFRNIFFQKKCQDEPKYRKERNVGGMLDAGVYCGGHPRNPAHWPSRKPALPVGGLSAPSQDGWALQSPQKSVRAPFVTQQLRAAAPVFQFLMRVTSVRPFQPTLVLIQGNGAHAPLLK